MPRKQSGRVYPVRGGYGIRWTEDEQRPTNPGPFKTKTAAREWWRENVATRLERGGPSPLLTFDAFADLYLERWGATVKPRTVKTVEIWLRPARATFGSWRLAELENAAADVAAWRATLRSDDERYKCTRGLRQCLAAAVRWRYLTYNPAVEAGANPQPRGDEIEPFTIAEVDGLVEELSALDGAIVLFAAETGLRTNEWVALERRDLDRANPAIAITRRYSGGALTEYPKTERRRVPLTPRAQRALELVPARLDSPLLFPAPEGGRLNLDNWRARRWDPALEAAGLARRGPYQLRHTFASEALAGGVGIWRLSKLMGASIETLERHYAHLVRDDEDHVRELLSRRAEGLS